MASEEAYHGGRKGGLFSAVNALRDAPEEDEGAAEEREKALFHENTICGKIARSKIFEWSTLGVIVLNALYLGYDCDYNARWGKPDDLYASTLYGFMIFDNFFCLFFTAEVVIRFAGYKKKMSCLNKPFFFDLFLVALMIVETWILAFLGPIAAMKQVSILRLLRLARLFRMAKLMRYFPELQLIVKGMVAAVRSVGSAGFLLVLVLYVFAIIFTNEYHQGLKADDAEDITDIEMLFGSMGKSMRHLLIMATILDDITACCNAIRASGSIMMLLLFMCCVMISSFTLFNMLLGILCEVVEATEAGEKEKEEQKKLRETMMEFFKTMDLDANGSISRNEFLQMSNNEDIMNDLEKLDIDHKQFEKYAELLFTPKEDGGPLPSLQYKDAVTMIMRLRPGQSVNACDFEYFKNVVMQGSRETDRYLTSLETLLEEAAGVDHEEESDESISQIAPYHQANSDSEEVALKSISPMSNDPLRQASHANDPPLAVSNAKVGQRNSGKLSRQVSPPSAGGGAGRSKAGSRGGPTIRTLAQSQTAGVAAVPPVASRWATPPEEGEDPVSPLPPSPQPGRRSLRGEEMVAERLNHLAEKRRAVSLSLRASMGHVGPGTNKPVSTFHMTQYSNSMRAAPPYAKNSSEGAADDEQPFSPQGFSFSDDGPRGFS